MVYPFSFFVGVACYSLASYARVRRFTCFLFVCFRYQSSRFASFWGGRLYLLLLFAFFLLFVLACHNLHIIVCASCWCSHVLFRLGGLSLFGKSVTQAVEGGVGPHQYLWVSYSLPLQMLQDGLLQYGGYCIRDFSFLDLYEHMNTFLGASS